MGARLIHTDGLAHVTGVGGTIIPITLFIEYLVRTVADEGVDRAIVALRTEIFGRTPSREANDSLQNPTHVKDVSLLVVPVFFKDTSNEACENKLHPPCQLLFFFRNSCRN